MPVDAKGLLNKDRIAAFSNRLSKMKRMALNFLHLSDLHLRERDLASQVNPDADLRNELLRDLNRIKGNHQIGGVLVTGDVAFAGQPNEYEEASYFLEKVTNVLAVEPDKVWVSPGNHDIDRNKQTPTVKRLHATLRAAAKESRPALDRELRELLEEDDASPLFNPLESYNAFASRYGCRSEPSKLAWQQDFPLDYGWTLRVHGLNSALVSGAKDNQNEGRLVLGSPQWEVPNLDGVCHLVMCHHPLDWLFEYEDIEDSYERRIKVLLCGHKHRQRTRSSNYTVVHAGALHPDRHEAGWDPRYNVVSIGVKQGSRNPELCVRVFERQYKSDSSRFTAVFDPDTEEKFREHCYHLEMLQLPQENKRRLESSSDLVTHANEHNPPKAQREPQPMTRSLLYRFYGLSLPDQLDIVTEMRLAKEGDQLSNMQDLLRHALQRVKDEGRVAALDEAIRRREERR
jgi:hypothetical protein